MTETQVWIIILMVANHLITSVGTYGKDGVHSLVMMVSLVFLGITFLKSAIEGFGKLAIWWLA